MKNDVELTWNKLVDVGDTSCRSVGGGGGESTSNSGDEQDLK